VRGAGEMVVGLSRQLVTDTATRTAEVRKPSLVMRHCEHRGGVALAARAWRWAR